MQYLARARRCTVSRSAMEPRWGKLAAIVPGRNQIHLIMSTPGKAVWVCTRSLWVSNGWPGSIGVNTPVFANHSASGAEIQWGPKYMWVGQSHLSWTGSLWKTKLAQWPERSPLCWFWSPGGQATGSSKVWIFPASNFSLGPHPEKQRRIRELFRRAAYESGETAFNAVLSTSQSIEFWDGRKDGCRVVDQKAKTGLRNAYRGRSVYHWSDGPQFAGTREYLCVGLWEWPPEHSRRVPDTSASWAWPACGRARTSES